MYKILVLLFLYQYCVTIAWSYTGEHTKTIYGNYDSIGSKNTLIIDAETHNEGSSANNRQRRSTDPTTDGIATKINHLNDTRKQLMVHWVGEKSKVVICLARDPAPIIPAFTTVNPSAVYISYDDGDTYENKTDSFKLENGSYATLEKFYNHPKYNTHFVFTDIRHNMMYLTKDHGKTFKNIKLDFTPSEVSFHEWQPSTFVVLDKNNSRLTFWITEDFGENFRLAHEFVKSFYWMKDSANSQQLLLQRYEPSGLSTIIFSKNLFRSRASQIYTTNVKDFFFKGDYLFTTKINAKGDTELFVSYKLGRQLRCIFNSVQKFRSYYIVDVTGSRAFIAVSHSDTFSNLYVSENLGGNDGEVKFTLSLENAFAYFPNTTWQDSWLHHISEDAFADVYKVEGLSGIYIASKVIGKPNITIGPQHLASVITFNHGATWRPIQPPTHDVEGQPTDCSVQSNCSLHLSQKFNQLYPETRSVAILSSKSAPGIILATGVVGDNLKGHHGVYISLDGGLTWRQTLRELFFFNMGDHGGILSAVKYYRSKGETRHILYSIDQGETWNMTVFHNEEMRLYGLMTEPGENSTVFTLFGSLAAAHQWIIVKIDFGKVFNRTCAEADYKMWSPSQTEGKRSYVPCVLGQQTTYQRRMPHALCLNGLDYVRLVSKETCDCDILDFECDFGFVEKAGNPPRCIFDKTMTAYDPYKAPSTCKPGQFYNRTKGYRKISGDTCRNGFESHYLPDQVPCPIEEIDDFILFAQKERISQYNLKTRSLEELPVKNLKNVIATDFDLSNNCVYWADIAWDTIGRQCFSNGSKVETLVSSDLASIEGMAFDWISKNLYFVDGVRAKIELIRTNINYGGRMRRVILDSKVLTKPRGIALHPEQGYMFWTDWSAENPSINRANLDGSNHMKLFGKNVVEWPNGITIDYIANRIYWVDAKKDYIGSSDLQGDGFVKIVSEVEVVSHPFAIAVFKHDMYWDDWKRNSIFVADKDTFRGVGVIVKQLHGLMDLKVFAHGLQIGTNACSNTTCSYICVGLPKNEHACLCPDGLTLKNGKCLCPGDVEPFANMTCPMVEKTCSSDHFACGNGLCIPKGWKCDSEDDCGDNSDEAQCGMDTCPPTFFVCGDGRCIPHYWKCDYDTDCTDGSDEMNCPRQNCTDGQFACDNGRCISHKWKCDGENDCRDNSDEKDCSVPSPTSCKTDEFQCHSGSVTCIPSTWKCDGEPDCRDSSDELDCRNNTCSEIQFSCGPPTNRCIYSNWVCDGDIDCTDGRDEANCTTGRPEVLRPTNNFNIKNGTCQEWMFRCKNERCIPFWWKCDGADDCGDKSDEVGCPPTVIDPVPNVTSSTTAKPAATCAPNQFQCLTGDCIFSSWVCDGMVDCPKGEDESHCDSFRNCSDLQFRCKLDGSCVSLTKLCNGILDCPDGTDELACNHNTPNTPATPSCSSGMFPCDGNTCFPLTLLCDGKMDCQDGYDESNCTKQSRIYQATYMALLEKGTTENSLVLSWWVPNVNQTKLQFLPSISKAGENHWINASEWIDDWQYKFTGLQPFTKYNMTVYVRLFNTSTAFVPANYFDDMTLAGVPSEPRNVSVTQKNGSVVIISWTSPVHPNGMILKYNIFFTVSGSSNPLLLASTTGDETSYEFATNFEHNVTYSFWVTAHNHRYEGPKSLPAKMVYDEVTVLKDVYGLMVQNISERGISLAWKYDGEVDQFVVAIDVERPYPHLTSRTTKTKNITIQLSPGAHYSFKISAVKNSVYGPESTISATTTGITLPRLIGLDAVLIKDSASVKVSWEQPKYIKKAKWAYGIYYGIKEDDLFKGPALITSNESETVSNLDACETYIFTVGLVGPMGFGPLSTNFKQINSFTNDKAPPKNVHAIQDPSDPARMIVSWSPPCPLTQPQYYVIKVVEKTTTRTWQIRVNGTVLSNIFNISYGGIYNIIVTTDQINAENSKPAQYTAPPILPPFEVEVVTENNGSYVVYWQEQTLPASMGKYFYEVLVHEGILYAGEESAQKFTVEKPPFVYTNFSASNYTFTVRIKMANGLKSQMSASYSKRGEEFQQQASTNLSAIIIPSLLVLLALLGVITFLVVRNRRLHSNFTRFTNSHYDTRSEAATFDDNGLEEDESPHIRGFSDDEPLVIA